MTYKDWADKLQAIESYLQSLFPESLIERIEDPLRCQLFRKNMFRLEDRENEIVHFFSLDYDYLDRNTLDEVIDLFEKRNVKNILADPVRKEVIMTDDGMRVIPRKKIVALGRKWDALESRWGQDFCLNHARL
jgi:hypothetical protein